MNASVMLINKMLGITLMFSAPKETNTATDCRNAAAVCKICSREGECEVNIIGAESNVKG